MTGRTVGYDELTNFNRKKGRMTVNVASADPARDNMFPPKGRPLWEERGRTVHQNGHSKKSTLLRDWPEKQYLLFLPLNVSTSRLSIPLNIFATTC